MSSLYAFYIDVAPRVMSHMWSCNLVAMKSAEKVAVATAAVWTILGPSVRRIAFGLDNI